MSENRNKEELRQEGKGNYCYEYPRPSLTSDSVIFGFDGRKLKILLVERGVEPFKGCWALPGGFMKMNESIDECARRELQEETGVDNVYLEQFHVFSDPGRDPRGRVVTVAFIALVRPEEYNVVGGDDASSALWFDASELPPLAFDHREIVRKAREHLREMLKVKPLAFQLLDRQFSVDELRKVYEEINGTAYDRRNFQRKLLQNDLVEEVEPEAECIMESRAAYECCCDEAPEQTRKPSARKLKKYSLKPRNKPADEDSDEEGSIKDLFNF